MAGMGAIKAIGSGIGNTIARATNSKPAKWLGEKWNKSPESTLALATVTSIVLKDGIGCVMYVTQSLNNKKIPDEKRKFVAALDLTNGVLMIAAQIAMFFAMRKYSGPIFERLFKKSFNAETKANIISKIRMDAAHSNGAEPIAKKLKIEKDYDKVKKDSLDLFKFVADIAAATIIGKRVIVPLIATPLAKKVEKKMEAYNAAKGNKEHKLDVNTDDLKEQLKNSPETIQPTFVNKGDTNLLNQFKNNN